MNRLTSGLLFLPLQEGIKADTVNRENPVTRSWKVTVRLTLSATDPFYLDLIMFVYEVQRSIARKKGCYGFSVLYDLSSNALADSTVGLAALHTNLLQDDRF